MQSSIEFKSLCKLAQKGDPAPDDVDEILSEALNGENSIHEEDSTPEVLISESTTGLVDSLNAAMEMSVEERESNDDGSEVSTIRLNFNIDLVYIQNYFTKLLGG